MARFVRSSVQQEFGRLVNIDLVTSITYGDDHITFHYAKEHMTVWEYKDNEARLQADWAILEAKLAEKDLFTL
ncbi:MAG TPA: hypothetical protein VFS25_17110 [Chitinophaga sp.]|jgi:hypothetical protein|uniref:hypothetical protein n=1 Tax=Chitinophaga sp. TaxID=1869181 RepID=UPI002DB5AEA6|nr:hypothetical protein [Chitinophaga sp.]HEU4554568.1 hypothetical protein [Chitinophaga sp.]